jgi:hypothetical protein
MEIETAAGTGGGGSGEGSEAGEIVRFRFDQPSPDHVVLAK